MTDKINFVLGCIGFFGCAVVCIVLSHAVYDSIMKPIRIIPMKSYSITLIRPDGSVQKEFIKESSSEPVVYYTRSGGRIVYYNVGYNNMDQVPVGWFIDVKLVSEENSL